MSGSGEKKQLGKILLKQKLVTPQELDDIVDEQQRHPGQRIGQTAVQKGRISEVDLLKALSEQHGVPGIDLGQVVVPLENLDLIPADVARQHLILPILVKEDRILLAMADPSARRSIDEIEFVTGRRVFPYVALEESLVGVIEQAYASKDAGGEYFIGPDVTNEYLASIGLSRPEPAPRAQAAARAAEAPSRAPARPPTGLPPTAQPGVLVDRKVVSSAPPLDDELGLAELSQKASKAPASTALDDAFGSRVGPLPGPPKARADQPKVLVVDDEDDIRKLLVRVLTQKGYQVLEAAKGLEALTIVRDQTPDVILLDAMLPEVHGFDICRRIKGSKRYGHIPIIMVSAIYRGWRVAEDLRTSFGVEAFLEKPFKIGDVIAHVESALAGRGSPVPPDDVLGQEAQKYLEQAMTLYRANDLDGAIEKLREGLGVDPLAFQLHYHLGLLWGRRDNVFEAIHALERAVDLSPRHFSALKNLAVLYQRVGFKHKAIEMWERALANAPDEETRQGIKDHLMSLL